MNPAADINLALVALQAVLGLISSIKASSGLTDDALLAEAQKVTVGNDVAYAALVKALTPAAPAAPATVTTTTTVVS